MESEATDALLTEPTQPQRANTHLARRSLVLCGEVARDLRFLEVGERRQQVIGLRGDGVEELPVGRGVLCVQLPAFEDSNVSGGEGDYYY